MKIYNKEISQDTLVKIILENLSKKKDDYSLQFQENGLKIGTNFFIVDKLLPDDIANQIFTAFPQDRKLWREIKSLREKKLTSKQFHNFPKILRDTTFAIQNVGFIDLIEEITGFNNLSGDKYLYAGGLSQMQKGGFLNPHYDNSHDKEREKYRRINLLYYVTPNWKLEFGGNLELWDKKVKDNITIPSLFNRLVVMETNKYSWHSVSKVLVDKSRCCVSNYYFSDNSPNNNKYFHITGFHGRPKEYIKRIILPLEGIIRNTIRKIFYKGFSKNDIFLKK